MISFAVPGTPIGTDPHERVAAGLILRRGDDHRGHRADGPASRWLMLKARKHHEWGFPKGHLDPGETALAAALRECAEETGIGVVAIEAEPLEIHYRMRDGRAKRVIYFPAVTSIARVQLSHEHVTFDWVGANRVQRLLDHENLRALFAAYLHRLRTV